MTTIDIEAERLKFEAWARPNPTYRDADLLERRTARDGDGREILDSYFNDRIQNLWQGWLAAKRDAGDDARLLDWLDSQAADGVHLEVCYSGSFDARTLDRKATVYVGRPQSEHRGEDARSAIRTAINTQRQSAEGQNHER